MGATGASRGMLGRMNILFDEGLSQRLREFSRSRRTLAANVMLSIYVTALSRHCNQKDFVVPCFVAGRQSEHKSVVGYFSHIVYVRVRLAGTETFGDVLHYVANEFFRALSHQDFGRMAIQVPELLNGTFFQWLTWPPEEACKVPTSADPDTPALVVEKVSVAEFAEYLTAIPPGMVDVELTFFDASQGIYASGVYRADLFTQAAMDRFMVYLRSTAEACLRDPDTPGTS
jgi:non-ribosomal peptide synthetase component F